MSVKEDRQFSMVVTVRVRQVFANGWKDSREGGQVLLILLVLGRHRLLECVVKEQIEQRTRDN
jgi:hypothetical protein